MIFSLIPAIACFRAECVEAEPPFNLHLVGRSKTRSVFGWGYNRRGPRLKSALVSFSMIFSLTPATACFRAEWVEQNHHLTSTLWGGRKRAAFSGGGIIGAALARLQ